MPGFSLFRHYDLKILIVVDGSVTFGHRDFGLSTLVKALGVSAGSWVRFVLTKAHRGTDSFDYTTLAPAERAQLEPQFHSGFRFTQAGFDINAYDEVWLFGAEGVGSANAMSDDELKVLSRFMDQGGGVFATGDHEDLGYALCGRIPRVRSMRKWYWQPPSVNPGNGPENALRAPDGHTENRYDTLQEGHDAGFQFDDQSDDVPQPIQPTMYSQSSAIFRYSYPHPLLCGPRGVIRVLPDHPHEGECVVPADLSRSYTFSGYTTVEYPPPAAGGSLAPEIVATGRVIGGHVTTLPFGGFKPAVNPRTFAVIAAYDGQRANVGRVSVDSTWHHFFDINLVGTGSADPTKTGLGVSTSGQAAFEAIKAYYRNIAVWLAPAAARAIMMSDAIWNARWTYPLLEELRPDVVYGALELNYFGKAARDALGRFASQCQTRQIVIDLHKLIDQERLVWPPPDPWHPEPGPGPGPDPGPWIDMQVAEDMVLGAAIAALAKAVPYPDAERARDALGSMHAILASGAAHGASVVRHSLAAHTQQLGAVLERAGSLKSAR